MSVRVTNRIWETSKMKGGPLVLLLAIADNADDNGVAWPGIAYLARKCRMTERQVYNNISTCMQAKELDVTPGGGRKTNRYRILCAGIKLEIPTPEKISGVNPSPLQPASPEPCNGLQSPLKPTSGEPSLTFKEPSQERARPIRKRVKKLDDLTTNDYFRWLIYEHAPHVDLELALREFVNYCASKGEIFKDYAAAFENSVLRQEAWWLKDNPDAGAPGTLMYGDFKPDNSPARRAYRAAYIAWKDEGEHGEPPSVQSFDHLNQRGPDV